MRTKWKDMEESSLIFLDWPEIEVNEENIILKSSVTRIIIGKGKENHVDNSGSL
ncbi:MAG: hypothetical protein JSV09_16770 [Thermoplasmata archaeon]|nr:MAG: hypothetical protein JSV09_16770 [Thermoplasmata archaeon]